MARRDCRPHWFSEPDPGPTLRLRLFVERLVRGGDVSSDLLQLVDDSARRCGVQSGRSCWQRSAAQEQRSVLRAASSPRHAPRNGHRPRAETPARIKPWST